MKPAGAISRRLFGDSLLCLFRSQEHQEYPALRVFARLSEPFPEQRHVLPSNKVFHGGQSGLTVQLSGASTTLAVTDGSRQRRRSHYTRGRIPWVMINIAQSRKFRGWGTRKAIWIDQSWAAPHPAPARPPTHRIRACRAAAVRRQARRRSSVACPRAARPRFSRRRTTAKGRQDTARSIWFSGSNDSSRGDATAMWRSRSAIMAGMR
jgi:hypothetical protein